MDHNFNDQPKSSTPLQATAIPSSQSRNQQFSRRTRIIFAGLTCVFLVVSLAVSAAALYVASQKADKSDQAAQEQTTKSRLEALEAADKFTEQQVDKDRYQAVFLSTGQVYFGKITNVTRDTMKLEDIYYLKGGTIDKSDNPAFGADAQLVKLGNELHAPDDAMLIERKNLTFWENLKNDGQVVKAIAEYKKSNS